MTDTMTKNDSEPPKANRNKKLVAIGAAVLVAGGLAIPAAIFGPQLMGIEESAEQAEANAPAQASEPAGFTEFRNDEAGIALSYPSSWVELRPKKPEENLLIASDGGGNVISLRVVDLPKAVSKQEVESGTIQKETDQVVGANPQATLLNEPRQLELGGLPGYWYLYSFPDKVSGQPGVHSHYFIFDGKKMFSLVLQTVPAEKFQESAPVFDQITNSFRTLDT